MPTSSDHQRQYSTSDAGETRRRRQRRRLTRRAVKLMTAATMFSTFAALFGATVTVTVVGLIMATPLLVIFSPVLVPAVLVAAVVAVGLLVSGGCGVAAAGALGWLYAYVTGRRPPGTGRLEDYYGSWPAKVGEKVSPEVEGFDRRDGGAAIYHLLPPAS